MLNARRHHDEEELALPVVQLDLTWCLTPEGITTRKSYVEVKGHLGNAALCLTSEGITTRKSSG